jgi:hypothetical protein
MSYPKIDQNEQEQIMEVFRLTGGELADKPLRYLPVDGDDPEERRWARYFYDGAPPYIEWGLEFKLGGTFLTIVTCELYGEMPKRIMTSDGRVWRKVRTFRSSGEAECPCKGVDTEDLPKGTCPLCAAKEGEEHGMIYIGEGWAEVVYRTRS